MSRYFSDLRDAMRLYSFARLVISSIAGLGGLGFFCLCIWINLERGEATATNLALITVAGLIILFFNGGIALAKLYGRNADTTQTFQQTTTTATSTPTVPMMPVVVEEAAPPVNPAGQDPDPEDVK